MAHDTPAPPDGTDDNLHHTQEFSAYQPPPESQLGEPRWSVPAPAPARQRRRGRLGLSIGLVVVLVLGLSVALAAFTPVGDWFDGSGNSTAQAVAGTQRYANSPDASANSGSAAAVANLRQGGVFLNTNNAAANEVIALVRGPDGALSEVGRYRTGGTGSATGEDIANGMVLGSANGESSPIHTVDDTTLLFVANAGSDTISVFRVRPDRLELVSEVPSGGEKPVSLTVSHGLLYVLNSGEFDDRLVVGPNTLLENCTTGQLPSVTGFRVDPDGALTQIPSSTRLLTGTRESGCAQVSFTPDGHTLVVSERIAGKRNKAGIGKGAFVTFQVRQDGTLGTRNVVEPTGSGPFGFTFANDGTLLSTEQYGAMDGLGHVTSYTVNDDGTMTPNQKSIPNGQSDTCWIVLTEDQKLAFSSGPAGGGAITSYRVAKDGTLDVLHPVASAPDGKTADASADHTPNGIIDLTLSRDSKYLYVVGAIDGAIYTFQVEGSGMLSYVGKTHLVDITPFEQGGEGVPLGIAAS
jgi:6-phosphogluconolactonase